jgi:hypothetical protein
LTLPLTGINHIGYFLDTSADINYRQINNRNIHDICKNSTELLELYLNENIPYIDLLTTYKYKVRVEFPASYDIVKENLVKLREKAIKKGYTIMTGQEILDDLHP